MFAELAAIGSALSAINSTIATLKESKQNAEDAAGLLGKFSQSAQGLDKWEKKKNSKRPLTPKEAMDLSIQRRKIKDTENKLKDHLLMMGMSDVWRESERIRKQSEKEHQQYLKDIHKKRKIRKKKIEERLTAAFIVFSLVFLCFCGWYIYEAVQKKRIETVKERLEQAKERQRNMRKCGRFKC